MVIAKQLGEDVTYKQVTSWFKHKRENDKAKGIFTYKYSPAAKFSNEEVVVLEEVFTKEPYAKGKILQDLAVQLGVSDKRVQNWFKHKRSRLAQQGKFEYKPRNVLSTDQITFLKGAFCTNTTPTQEVCEQLSVELNIRPEQVARWFSSERSRKRRREQSKQSIDDTDSEDDTLEVSNTNNPYASSSKKKAKRSSASNLMQPDSNAAHLFSSVTFVPSLIPMNHIQLPTSYAVQSPLQLDTVHR